MNRRRALLTLLGLGLGLPDARGASAQATAKIPVVGLLDAGQRLEWWAVFRKKIQELGYGEGQTVAFEERFANGKSDRLTGLAQDLVRLKVAVIVTSGTVTATVARDATRTIPIVMATGDDPVAGGLVKSLARPGGNVTGVTSLNAQVMGKRLEQFHEALPKIARLAVLWDRENSASAIQEREVEAIARSSRIAIQSVAVKTTDELPQAFTAMIRERAGGVFVLSGPSFFTARQRLAELALKYRLPSMYSQFEYVDAGGLLSYGQQLSRPLPAGGALRRQDSQGRQSGRAPDRATDKVRASHQPQDGPRARHYTSQPDAAARGPVDSMKGAPR